MINHELYVIYGVSYPVIYLSVLVLLLQVQVRVVVVVMVMAMVMVQINRIRFLFLIGYGRKTHERLCLPFSKRDSQVPLVSFMISNLVMKLFPFSIDHSGSKPFHFYSRHSFDGLFVRMCPFDYSAYAMVISSLQIY